jgi:hypothetical protein
MPHSSSSTTTTTNTTAGGVHYSSEYDRGQEEEDKAEQRRLDVARSALGPWRAIRERKLNKFGQATPFLSLPSDAELEAMEPRARSVTGGKHPMALRLIKEVRTPAAVLVLPRALIIYYHPEAQETVMANNNCGGGKGLLAIGYLMEKERARRMAAASVEGVRYTTELLTEPLVPRDEEGPPRGGGMRVEYADLPEVCAVPLCPCARTWLTRARAERGRVRAPAGAGRVRLQPTRRAIALWAHHGAHLPVWHGRLLDGRAHGPSPAALDRGRERPGLDARDGRA